MGKKRVERLLKSKRAEILSGPRELILRSEISAIKTSSGKNEILEGRSKESLKRTSLEEVLNNV